ncbi:anion permease [Tissierella praeacuta]|uniref:SLC13 family permease n=1 Tax=Tissierella praeacuta TaxID=43131 RepID=UPI00333FF6CE
MSKKNIYLIISILILVTIIFIKPFGLDFNQSMILGSVIMVILWWGTNCISKSLASIIIITIFFIFSDSSPQTILKFPLSSNLILIISSYLIAHGIKVSGLADRISRLIISRYANSSFSLIVLSFVLSFILIFLIPQTFPRAIILAAIYEEYLSKEKISSRQKSIVLFSVFVAVSVTSMAFINGDVILNNAAIQFAGLKLSYTEWVKYMFIPSIIISVFMFVGFVISFYKDIKGDKFEPKRMNVEKTGFTSMEKKGGIITALIILLWTMEPIHNIDAAWVSVLGVIIMHVLGLIKLKDYKIVKLDLLLFLTAAFSIGGVLNEEGIAGIIFNKILPSTNSDNMLVFYSILVVMALHMILGSSMTTMSICMPVIMSSLPNTINPISMMLIIYTIINVHYILPIHHVVIMIGEGEGHYHSSMTIKYGVFLSILAFISVYLILIPYWKIVGLF